MADIVALLDTVKKKAERQLPASPRYDRMMQRLAALRKKYAAMPPPADDSAAALSLVDRTKKLLAASNFGEAEFDAILRHASAAWYDLAGVRWPYQWYVRCFFVSTIGFFLLAPQFFPAILALIFIVPVFVGLKGLKARTLNGFTLTAMIYPVALLSATTAARSFLGAIFGDLAGFAGSLAQTYHLATGTVEILVVVFALIAAVTIPAALAGAYLGFRYRDMFV